MSRIALSNTGDWKLQYDEQDVRGYRALAAEGGDVGIVDTMVVNTDQRRVDSIILRNGDEYPASEVSIGDGVVYLTSLTSEHDDYDTVTVYNDYGQVVEREEVEDGDVDAHVDAFRQHYASSYGDGSYDDLDPAYRYGYESAYADRYRNRGYIDAEDDLRTGYASQYADRDFDSDRSAIRYGYTRAQHGS